MGLIKGVFYLFLILIVAGTAFYFAPSNIKEKGLSMLMANNFIPSQIKDAAAQLYATPKYKREKLIQDLQSSFGNIEQEVKSSSKNPEPILQQINQAKETLNQILQTNNEPTILQKITDTVAQKIVEQGAGVLCKNSTSTTN